MQAVAALASSSAPILPSGRSVGGILERVQPLEDGLLQVSLSGRSYSVDDSLLEALTGLIGQMTAIFHYGCRWGAGAMPA